jgi:hypothetical protein
MLIHLFSLGATWAIVNFTIKCSWRDIHVEQIPIIAFYIYVYFLALHV